MTREEQIEKIINDDWNHLEGDCPDVAFRKGVNWADAHPQQNWHKYPEDKPRHSDTYIVAFDNEMVSAMMYYTDLDMFDGNYISKIVAWMKLPKPPKFD